MELWNGRPSTKPRAFARGDQRRGDLSASGSRCGAVPPASRSLCWVDTRSGTGDCFARQDVSAGLRSDGARLRSPRGSLVGWRRALGRGKGIRAADPATLDGRAGSCSAADGVRAAKSQACRQPHRPRLRPRDRRMAPSRARCSQRCSRTPIRNATACDMSLSDPQSKITPWPCPRAASIETGSSRVCGACGSQRPAAARKKVTPE